MRTTLASRAERECHLSVGASSEPVYELTEAHRALAPVLREGDRRVADGVVTMLAGSAAWWRWTSLHMLTKTEPDDLAEAHESCQPH
jgi:hypothetical protein